MRGGAGGLGPYGHADHRPRAPVHGPLQREKDSLAQQSSSLRMLSFIVWMSSFRGFKRIRHMQEVIAHCLFCTIRIVSGHRLNNSGMFLIRLLWPTGNKDRTELETHVS